MIQLPCRLPTTLVHGMHTVALVASPVTRVLPPPVPSSSHPYNIQHSTSITFRQMKGIGEEAKSERNTKSE